MNARYLFAALCLGTAVAGLAELPPFYPELAPEHAFDSALTPPNEIAVNGVKPGNLHSPPFAEWQGVENPAAGELRGPLPRFH